MTTESTRLSAYRASFFAEAFGKYRAATPLKRPLIYKVLLAGWVITFPLLVLSLFLLLIILFLFFPFDFKFTVVNQSGEQVWVTPIGAMGKDAKRSVLPLMVKKGRRIFPAVKLADFEIGEKGSRTFVYDTDDINLSELVIRRQDGTIKKLVIDENPEKNQYHSPASDRFVIPRLEQLPNAEPKLIKAAEHKYYFAIYLMLLSGLIPVVLFTFWFRMRMKGARY